MQVALAEAHAFLENAAANFIGELAAAVLILVISGLMYRGSSPSKKIQSVPRGPIYRESGDTPSKKRGSHLIEKMLGGSLI
jgi:hypothetical protein